MAESARLPKEESVAVKQPTEKPTPLLYTNAVGLAVGLYDFTFLFGHRMGEAEPTQDVAVVMSPQQAAAVYAALGKTIKGYEEKFGKIMLPDDLLAQLEAKVDKGQ